MAGKSGKHSSSGHSHSEHGQSAHSPSHDSKRELIEPHEGDKRYVRRDAHGHFTDSQDDVGRSLSADRRQHAKHESKPGQGDRGDRSR